MDSQNNLPQNSNNPQGMTNLNLSSSFFSKLKFFLVKNKSIILIIAVLTLISFGSTTYLLMTNKKSSSSTKFPSISTTLPSPTPTPLEKISETPTPTLTPTPSIPMTELTASWSAYVSSKYSYSIKYPIGWIAQKTVQQDPKILEYVVFNPKDATSSGNLSITLSYGTRTYNEALLIDPQVGEALIVASVSATKKNTKNSDGVESTSIIIPTGTNTIIMYAKAKYVDILTQMLTTLKLPI
ncbi:MAG: hypothetical protein HY424_00665 [Candidatus Levybacteria bacterium]|nr:hypothetical protein [Candidatus Levybacteria bacterium]